MSAATAQWVDDLARRAIDRGYNAFCLTVDTDSYSRHERDIAKRHQRQRVRVADARIFQAQFNWCDIERIKKRFDIPLVLKGIATPGVVRLFEILKNEIRVCFPLLGVSGYGELDRSYIRPARQVMQSHVHSALPHLNLPRESY
jgi:isopentenyl diphosphate isomerase/L-lactate dehydrogenase-like FMN-dependent dehydrogenase